MVEVYLLTGPEEGMKVDFIRQTVEAQAAGRELDGRKFFTGADSLEDLLSFLRTPSLFGQWPVAEWSDVATLKGADLSRLLDYCAKPTGSGLLFLCTSAFKVAKGLSSCVDKSRQKTFWEMFENRKVPWLKQYFRSYGYHIGQEACEYLLAAVENETGVLRLNCELVMLYANEQRELSATLVEEALIHSKHESVFSLFDQLTAGSLAGALAIAQVLESRGEAPVSLLAGLQRQFAKLTDIKHARSRDCSFEQIFKTEGVLHRQAQNSFRAGCQRYSIAQLGNVNHLLLSCDLQSRQQHGPMLRLRLRYLLYQCFACPSPSYLRETTPG